jgi:hypothetical protein
MKNPPIKIVRPWPAEQPRPPVIRKTQRKRRGERPAKKQ